MTKKAITGQNHKTGDGFPLGVDKTSGGVQFTTSIPFKHTLELVLYDHKGEPFDHINMTDHTIAAGLFSCIVDGDWPEGASYCYEADGIKVPDPFMKNSTAKRAFGDAKCPADNGTLYCDDFDWEDDILPHLPFDRITAYQLHVRGFTAHLSSKVHNRGKYSGIIEKIPYLLELGIDQIVLMPCYEFDEVIRPTKPISMDSIDYKADLTDASGHKINYWGYTKGYYYMPKAAYSNGDPTREFKEMVKACHDAGIEVVMRFYFPDCVNKSFIPDILRFWAKEYHVDGFFLMGSDIPIDMIAADVYLRDRKIYNNFFDKDSITSKKYGFNRNMAIANSDFMNSCRRFLKSDENQISEFLYRQRMNPYDVHTINYITDYFGFTLKDLVTFDYKHNEANNEDNNDGENFNYSWNCGVEGVSHKKSIIRLRLKQMKNALVFLFLAQGVPMLTAGDEICNSQGGNNNPYCQDNETGWVVWKDNKQTKEISDFTRMLIRLRKSHPVLHPEREFRLMDYAACGFPDLSYHGDMAWNARFDNHLRHAGIMICGKYARLSRTVEDDFFYFAYNMHWEDHTFALPKLPKDLAWSVAFLTCDDNAGAIVYNTLSDGGDKVTVPDRTVAVLKSVKCEHIVPDKESDKEKRIMKNAGR